MEAKKNKICRVCLVQEGIMIDLFMFSLKLKNRIADELMQCAPVHIAKDDELPSFICKSCYMELERTHRFRLRAAQSEITLQSSLKKTQDNDKQSVNKIKVSSQNSTSKSNVVDNSEETSNFFDNYDDPSSPCSYSSNQDIKKELEADKNAQNENKSNSTLPGVKRELDDQFLQQVEIWESLSEPNSRKRPFTCDLCGKSFGSISNLKGHRITHSTRGTVRYQCKICKKYYLQYRYLKRHKMRDHSGERPFLCDVCSKSFKDLSALKTHKRTHTGEKPFQCDICNACFLEARYLKRHKQRLHSTERPYLCDVCSKSFKDYTSLKVHKRLHTGEKPYECDVCQKRFRVSGGLKSHKRCHTGERAFQCNICGKCFTQPENLSIHKRLHANARAYQCDICNKCFTYPNSLKIHKRRHTGEKPYQCDICSQAFTQSSSLTVHKRRHTGEKPYECDICNKSFTKSSNLKKHKAIHVESADMEMY